MRFSLKLNCVALFLCAFAAVALASINGSISGVVLDPSGSVIAGAAVTATETQTGVKSETVTDSKGFYSFPDLPIGRYNVEVRAKGFKTYLQTGLVVDANSALRVDATLVVGNNTENVIVSSDAVHVDTESTQTGEVIERRKILAVPLNGRAYTDLLDLQPGVVPSAYGNQAPDTSDRSPSGTLNPGNQSINGQRESSNGFMVNGANVVEGKNNGAGIVPNLDSIEEFRIITNNFDAEYGNYSGGQINVATKAGTNAYHGSLFEFLRNTDFDARNFFNPSTVGPKDEFKQNQFGGTVGAPIKKDKLFFFLDYQGTRETKGNVVTTGAPSSTVFPDTSGNVNALSLFNTQFAANGGPNQVNGQTWADTLSTRLYGTTGMVQAGENYFTPTCTTTAQCVFPNGIIPSGAILPLSQKILPFFPSVNSTAATQTGSDLFTSALPSRLRDDKAAVRIDDNTRFCLLLH